jgi:hypothetical protein
MNSLLLRYRWAIGLAVAQGLIFAALCVSEHQRNLRYNHKGANSGVEYFGCFSLHHRQITSQEEQETRWDAIVVDCFPPVSIKYVLLANLPIFVVWGGLASLTRHTNVDQVCLFYAIFGIGVPALWFAIGSRIDRKPLRSSGATGISHLS